uniref:J domain-containing protein n=1 Tax=Chenopodium quinoa TaxID=63459 RepID=A0A803MTI2_CHEQI
MAEDDEFHNKEDGNKKLWGIVLFSLIGATATTFAPPPEPGVMEAAARKRGEGETGGHRRTAAQNTGEVTRRPVVDDIATDLPLRDVEINLLLRGEVEINYWVTGLVGQLRQFGRTVDWISAQMSRMQSQKGGSGSFRSSFQEEARRRYRQRMQEEYEEELERVMSAFADSCSLLPSRRRHGGGFQLLLDYEDKREDWYWTAESSFRDRKANYKQTPQHSGSYSLSRHYAVLGLDRLRTKPYTDDEIKSAFRAKALEYHPDQNQGNKEVAEEKFKEVMMSYEAIKSERKIAK